jgi:hypothetical protein
MRNTASTWPMQTPTRRGFTRAWPRLYLRSQELWLELDRGGKLAAVDRHWPREVALVGSENTIAKLRIQTP